MKRPEWAAAGTFAAAWQAASRAAKHSGAAQHRRFSRHVVEGLARAHVVTLDKPQVEALPITFDSYADSASAFLDARLPFDPVYLSLDGATLSRFDPPGRLLGALVGTPSARIAEDWDGRQPLIHPFHELPPGKQTPAFASFDDLVWATSDGWQGAGLADLLADDLLANGQITEDNIRHAQSLKADAAEIVAAVIYFLESANVELVEANPARQERRAVARKGGRVALTVHIRQPKRRPRSDGPAQHPNWTHRWEVRGHYKHFPVGTKLADSAPDKLVDHPTLGRCRRIWCPPFVKGPEDKPLIPKVRVVA